MPDVKRLPVQHKQKPHCTGCKKDLPLVGQCRIDAPADLFDGFELQTISYLVKCSCGNRFVMEVTVKA